MRNYTKVLNIITCRFRYTFLIIYHKNAKAQNVYIWHVCKTFFLIYTFKLFLSFIDFYTRVCLYDSQYHIIIFFLKKWIYNNFFIEFSDTFRDNNVKVSEKKMVQISDHLIEDFKTSACWQTTNGSLEFLNYLKQLQMNAANGM